MAGIAGMHGHANPSLLSQMLSKLAHRGSASQKIHVDSHTCVGQTNMKHQHWEYPFYDDGQIVLLMDGVVFLDNVGEIGPETICELYNKYGPGMLGNLKGYFSLALLKRKSLLLARDPFGIKPLYYGRKDGTLYFASEIKSLIGTVDNVLELPPGTMYHTQTGLHKYAHSATPVEFEKNEEVASTSIRNILSETVEKYCDNYTGAFLSGGIDSSVVAALASQHIDLHTFCAGVEGSEDLEAARIVAEHIGSEHYERVFGAEDILEILPRVIYHLESFDFMLMRSAVAQYFASEMASRYVESTLCGEGGDELFAGYEYLSKLKGKLLQEELKKITFNSFNTGFQRVDRITMAHSIEGKMPLLYNDFVYYSLGIAPWLKREEMKTEKWILRKAFEDLLPDEIVWRKKRKFAEGAGNALLIKKYAEGEISDREFKEERKLHAHAHIRTKEELYYFRIFESLFGLESVKLVGRTDHFDR